MVAALEKQFPRSVMMYITLSVLVILSIPLINIFSSYWITEQSDKDAQLINLSGSMRMQTYHIGLLLREGDHQQTMAAIEQLDKTWAHSLFNLQRGDRPATPVDELFVDALAFWQGELRPLLLQHLAATTTVPLPHGLFDQQVERIDTLVGEFQHQAEQRVASLRILLLASLAVTVLIGSLIFFLLTVRVEKPLRQLTVAAHRIGSGDYGYQVEVKGNDELGLMAAVLNQMSQSINFAYARQEEKIRQRTWELQRNNTYLTFMFTNSRRILDGLPFDYQQLVDELSRHLDHAPLELCLFSAEGEHPYLQFTSEWTAQGKCERDSCAVCSGVGPFCALGSQDERFPIIRHLQHYGVINVRLRDGKGLGAWQRQMAQSVADQLAIALSLEDQRTQERRLAMLNERAVIARELHDSLAQALSYLQIQVVRLQKSHNNANYSTQQGIIDELREGLSSAYRQLRELLTTFRLKIDAGGLRAALESVVNQLEERGNLEVTLDYQLDDLPLTPTEEIHLLQIIREAGQNAVYHSGGRQLFIQLLKEGDKVTLRVEDDGIGIDVNPHKVNHYGMAIMNERSRHLGSQVEVVRRAEGGTRVQFEFLPSCLTKAGRVA